MKRFFRKGFMGKFFLVGLLLSSFLTSCATSPQAKRTAEDLAREEKGLRSESKDAIALVLKSGKPDAEESKTTRKVVDIENLTIGEVIRIEEPNTANLYDNSRYDFPITMNSKVEGWIDYFTGRGRPHMERYLARSSRYLPLMKDVLKKNGLPEDLVYLALIESGFNLRAKSRARAVGAWQFMKATGKRYGLKVNAYIDERRDPVRSTEAAAKYLKDLYLMFESWYLAASAYNAGEYKILRAIEDVKTHNFWRIAETKAIRRETKDYVPKLISAAIIAKNPAKYGFEDIVYEEPLDFELVNVKGPMHLRDVAKLVDTSEEELLDLNPELTRGIVPPTDMSYDMRVPTGTKVLVEKAVASLGKEGAYKDLPLQHIVRSGETLRTIAGRYRMRVNELANANNMSPKEKLAPGAEILIPNRTVAMRTPTENKRVTRTTNSVSSGDSESGNFVVHTVQRGESLWSISEKYNVTIRDIFKWNNLKGSKVFPGAKLKVKPDKSVEEAANRPVRKNKRHS